MNCNLSRYLVITLLLVVPVTMAKTTTRAKHHTVKKKLVNITVTGITNKEILKNIDSALANIKATHLTKPINDDSLYNIYRDSPEAIRKSIQPYGYFKPTIDPSYKRINGTWYMRFAVHTGVRATVTAVNIKIIGGGTHDKRFLKVLTHYPLKTGQPFELTKYNTGNDLLFEHAANLGYFKARMTNNKIYVNLLNNTVKVDLVFNTGIRYRFGRTHFSKTPFNPKFLRKFMVYKEGQYYVNHKVQTTQNNFSNAEYFNAVIVRPEASKSVNYYTPMNIILKMRKRKEYTFGLGYGTDTQIRGTAGFRYRWVNSWGHYFDSKLQGSFVNYSLTAAYHIPWPNPTKDLISLRAGMGRLNLKRGKSKSQKISIDYRHTYTRWVHTLSFSFLNEHYDMSNLPRTHAKLFYPSANVTYYSTKNRITPNNGLRFSVDVSGTPSALSSKTGFFQVKLESKAIVTFFKHEQLVARLMYAKTFIKEINNLPLSLQLLAGGSQSIRGYDYQGIGPGRNLIVGSIEFRQRIYKQLFIAGFYDFGNVADRNLFDNLNQSAGPGILYRSPIGVIELDIAWRLHSSKRWPRIVFNIGPEL
ncbi:MAG: hypothetical protein COB66_04040 [Coxiella sp. (in: Bacteria)]|nr:MAG: hypothetical protein COB66_04040 [Coxiella sp. (in: g-proteobacteria)]